MVDPIQMERAAKALQRIMHMHDAACLENDGPDNAKAAFWMGVVEGGRCMIDHIFGPEHRFRVECHLKEQFALELPHLNPEMLG